MSIARNRMKFITSSSGYILAVLTWNSSPATSGMDGIAWGMNPMVSTFDDERRMQPHMDTYYTKRGFSIDRSVSCKGYDLRLTYNGKVFDIEEKYLFNDGDYDLLLVELIQCVSDKEWGWFYHTRCNYLHWIMCNNDRQEKPRYYYNVEFEGLKRYVIEELSKKPDWILVNVYPLGYGITINYPVNWNSLIDLHIAKRITINGDFINA